MATRKQNEIVGRYGVFDVLRHDRVDREGRVLRDAFTFACPDWVSVVPVTEEGSFVLVRQYRHGIDALTIEIPGGVMDEGETPERAAARELREETGYEAMALVSLGAAHPNPPLQNNRYYMFLSRGVRRAGEPQFDVGEACELLVVPKDVLRTMVREGAITHALVLLALERAWGILEGRGTLATP